MGQESRKEAEEFMTWLMGHLDVDEEVPEAVERLTTLLDRVWLQGFEDHKLGHFLQEIGRKAREGS